MLRDRYFLELLPEESRRVFPGMNAFKIVWTALRDRIGSFGDLFVFYDLSVRLYCCLVDL